jgi:hypothetical protein
VPATAPSKVSPKKDRIDLRLYNTIVIYDVYMIARSESAAKEALAQSIASGDARPTEIVAKEVTTTNSIRLSWANEAPFVAADVNDAEFETLKGITTSLAFERFYNRRS